MHLTFSAYEFPALDESAFTKTSETTPEYNCIAWAASDNKRYWWPSGFVSGAKVYWPKGAPNEISIKAFKLAFKSIGYEKCNDGNLQVGYEKIALYAINNKPTHAARQLADGRWTHKMGQNIDLTASLDAVAGTKYGQVVRFYKRKIK